MEFMTSLLYMRDKADCTFDNYLAMMNITAVIV
jgi:hypothetical protein